MSKENSGTGVDRRKFLAGVAVAGAASAVPIANKAKAAAPAPNAVRPTAAVQAAEAGLPQAGPYSYNSGKPGSDFMVDVVKSLNIDYVVTNPASSCRGIHESFINYGNNQKPEMLTCMHEESGVAMAQGYYKATGKPMMGLFHGTVGLQHATMGIYNAWCDRVPVIVVVGNHGDAASRRPGVPTAHSAIDPIGLIRDFTKWDDQPWSLQHFAESMVRAYKVAMTPPMEPVALSLDGHIQEHAIPEGSELFIPKYTPTAPPQGDSNAVREAARLLANADNPVIVADRYARTAEGIPLLVELAETLNATVVNQYGRMNFPNNHHLAGGGGAITRADVVLGLELTDFFGTVNRFVDSHHFQLSSRVRPGTRLISIGVGDLYTRANYQDFQRLQPVDVSIGADAQATMRALIDAVREEIPAARQPVIAQRGETARQAHAQARENARRNAMLGWGSTGRISSGRMAAEIWDKVKGEEWAFSGDTLDGNVTNLWTFDRHYQHNGGSGGAGVGYNLPAAVGAALGHRENGRLPINIQNDGDSMYAPGVHWTAAYHNIPMLSIMNNNRAYHREIMHVQTVGNWRDRGIANFHIGNEITKPNVQYAQLAQALGVVGMGPITDPSDLGPAITRGIEAVKAGEPVLIDVVTQPH
jgi:thiamine pyrophosphate-dependent acetolactate synthase large subunit-like protein